MGIFGKKNKDIVEQVEEKAIPEVEEVDTDEEEVETESEVETSNDGVGDPDEEEDTRSDEYVINRVTEHFTTEDSELLTGYERKAIPEKVFTARVKEYIHRVAYDKEQEERVFKGFSRYVWSYGELDPLIDDLEISDIKTYSHNNIRIKRNGHRSGTKVHFRNENAYRRAVARIGVKNKVSLSNQTALQTFTDKTSSKDFILRFTVTTEFVNTSEIPCVHVRKIPKHKYTTEQLIDLGFFTKEKADYLVKRAKEGDGILFCGKGASGKTTCMNWLIDHIPEDCSGLVIQENEELFSSHPDLLFQHTVANRGEGKIEYGLNDLARNGLLMDLDYFVIGEIKGGEAVYLLNAVYTGHKGWASVHGASSTEAMNKLVDYIKYNSDYSREDALEMLTHLDTVVFMKDFSVAEIAEVKGFDRERGDLIYERKF